MSTFGVTVVEAVPLPVGEAPGHRADVLVAELPERAGGEGRARAAGAVDDDLLCLVGDEGLDAALEVAARDVRGAGEVPLLPLVPLAHVEQQRPPAGGEERGGLGGRDLGDLGLDLAEELAVGRHYFPEYSRCTLGSIGA